MGGEFLIRIEDIDQSRARPHWEEQIFDDLEWLGLHFSGEITRQSDRMDTYDDALDHLWSKGLLYSCACNRRDIQQAMSAPQEGVPTHGPDGLIYPGTCRDQPRRQGPRPKDTALRLDMARALEHIDLEEIKYLETGPYASTLKSSWTRSEVLTQIGDVVLSRRDMGTSYHLSVTVDDHAQAISHVTRGIDLADATCIHVILQHLLGLSSPEYHHHGLIRDDAGKRLAKRDDARAIRSYRDDGATPEDIRRLVGFTPSAS